MMAFGEHKLIPDLVPDDFRFFFEHYDTVGAEANATLESVEKVGSDNGVDTIKAVARAPWPIYYRIMFSTRYLELDLDGGHMILFSGAGNDQYLNDPACYTAKEKADYVLATLHLTGWWAKPVKNEAGSVIGTHLLYFSQVDAGGSIPTFVQNSQGPKTALNSLKGCVDWVRSHKQA